MRVRQEDALGFRLDVVLQLFTRAQEMLARPPDVAERGMQLAEHHVLRHLEIAALQFREAVAG